MGMLSVDRLALHIHDGIHREGSDRVPSSISDQAANRFAQCLLLVARDAVNFCKAALADYCVGRKLGYDADPRGGNWGLKMSIDRCQAPPARRRESGLLIWIERPTLAADHYHPLTAT